MSKKVDKCVKKRERLFVRLQLCFDLIKDLPAKKDVFMARCSDLSALYSEFEEVSEEIDECNASAKDESEKVKTEAPCKQFDIIFYEIKAAYENLLKTIEVAKRSVDGTQKVAPLVQPKLPQIDINKFGGQLEQFNSFKSLYDNLIHTSSLASIEKFSYLKSLLEGPALSVVEAVPFDPDHYELAYNSLVERYTNPRILGTYYLNKILDHPTVKTANLASLRQLLDVFHINVEAIKGLKIDDLSSFIFLQLALRILDSSTRKAFEQEYKSVSFPTFDNLLEFLRSQCAIFELTKQSVKTEPSPKFFISTPRKALMTTHPKPSYRTDKVPTNTNEKLGAFCPLCKGDHNLYHCSQFLKMVPNQRHSTVRSLKRCFACLGSHMIVSCASKSSCRHCKSKKHHSLLHDNGEGLSETLSHTVNPPPRSPSSVTVEDPLKSQPPTSAETSVKTFSCSLNRNQENSTVILSTAKVLVKDVYGDWQPCRAVIDGGSQVNFITSSFAQNLKLPSRKCSLDVTGIGQSSHLSAKGIVTCTVASRRNTEDSLLVDAVIIPHISSELPALPLPDNLKKRFSSITLADPEFHIPAKIDMLFGAQAFTEILTDMSLIKGQPTALHTMFGWVLMGNVNIENPTQAAQSFFVSTPSIDSLLRSFWETEEVPTVKPPDPEAELCENHYQSTISRDETGRYIASLPFKEGKRPDLGSNREIALKKYSSLERRFNHQPDLRKLYKKNLQDYIDQKQMELASEPSSYILTHHGVRKDSSTSPLRVVFNASEISETNNSLNNSLLIGPKLQGDIGSIITIFRLNRIAITCDIKQMYRAIRLSEDDCKYQHIFWRPDQHDKIKEYELKRLTFGVSSSPFIAQRTLQQLVLDEGSRFPLAAQALTYSCYIDDIVSGSASEDQALRLHEELNQLLKLGGFELHKWSSSSTEVLKSIQDHHNENMHPLGSFSTLKVLGLEWDPSTDCFKYSITPLDKTPTKRNVLSQVARIYDVNGYISPVVFTLKHLLQEIWMEKLDWDDPLPTDLQTKWIKIVNEIPQLQDLKIPRYILTSNVSIQLIGFSDASKIGMCAVLYLRSVSENCEVFSHVIQSKTKVAPLKPLTIPRLELCAALLLARLVKANSHLICSLAIKDIILFTDSMNVLGWLQTPPHLLETFISNRVCKIIDMTPNILWHHVSGDQNPADCGSRGLTPSQIFYHTLWWHGPSFLMQSKSSWPISKYENPIEVLNIKLPAEKTLVSFNVPNYLYDRMSNYSTLNKLKSVMGYVLRFIHNTRQPFANQYKGPLSVEELTASMKACVRIVQTHHYLQEVKALQDNKPCLKTLRHLTPFLSQGFLMVGGRLRLSHLPERSKHPYLIPSNCHFANVLCDHYHIYSLHGGPKVVQSLIQRQYWIPSARNLIRKRIFKCLPCYKFKAKPIQPVMADLPPSRFLQGRCFENVGLDFAGPYLVKESTRRNARLSKGYVALFVCMSVKAIHLELVGSLTTEACLAAIDRFTSRRGLPRNIYSDQGTNFKGAARHLKEVYDLLMASDTQIQTHLSRQEIKWNFNPPHAANFGGLWEAGVKSMKHHLKRILENHHFTAEEFVTFLCRTESVLNSRPLCPLSNVPEDDNNYLSPGHFLVGGPLLSPPEESLIEEPANHLSRWQMINQASQVFWKRWSKDYLQTLMQRPKWTKNQENVNVGDVVLLFNINLSPLNWPLGRITQTFPGRDGIVRVVQVRTPNGDFTRPVNKIVALPFVK